jgi:hypothetical protein
VTATPIWRIRDDVLTRTSSVFVDHGSSYDALGGVCTDRYTGEVSIDRRTWRQQASSAASFTLTWGDVTVSTSSDVIYSADEHATTVEITLAAYEGTERVGMRTWRESYSRELG